MHMCQMEAHVHQSVLVQGFIGEVSNAHACLFVIKVIHAHVLLADFDRTVIERVSAVLTGGDGNHHLRGDDLPVDAPCALGRNSKNFAHNKLVLMMKQ